MKRSKKHPNVFSLSARSGNQAMNKRVVEASMTDVAPQEIDLSLRRTVRVEKSYFDLLSIEEQERLMATRNAEIMRASQEAYDREVAARILAPSTNLMAYFFRALERKIRKVRSAAV